MSETRLSHTTRVEVHECDDGDITMFTIEQETGCGDTQELTLTSDEMDGLINVAEETFSAVQPDSTDSGDVAQETFNE